MPAEITISIPRKRTPWFDAAQHRPAREGDYEVRFRLSGSGDFCTPRRTRWSNGEWQFDMTGGRFGTVGGDEWRGLMADASGVRGTYKDVTGESNV